MKMRIPIFNFVAFALSFSTSLFACLALSSSEFAPGSMRRYSDPPVRLRIDVAGSNNTNASSYYNGGPLGRQITKCSVRARIEIYNIGDVPQTVAIVARNGTTFSMWSKVNEEFAFGANGDGVPLDSDCAIAKKTLTGRSGADPTFTVLADLKCTVVDSFNGRCTFESSALGTGVDGVGTHKSDALSGSITTGGFLRDTSCSMTFALDVLVKDSKGAVIGTVSYIGNRGGGYDDRSFGEGIQRLNGGRPF